MERFNSRTPGGVRQAYIRVVYRLIVFQFTHPGRGATPRRLNLADIGFVSIHAPREGCDETFSLRYAVCGVSIHAPREGCDLKDEPRRRGAIRFQFTHPGRGATVVPLYLRTLATFQFTHPGRGATATK